MPVIPNAVLDITVLHSEDINPASMVVYFKRPPNFAYDAGDWVDLAKPDTVLKGGKTYSLSSAPTEDELAIMFRIGQSPFKQALQSTKPGDISTITQYGNDYDFHLREHRSSVLIAGGIGIAPFRSMLKAMVDTGKRSDVQLLYFNKGDTYLLHEQLEAWRQSLNIEIHYLNTTYMKRKDRARAFQTTMNRFADHYFIAGPAGMVDSTEHTLIDLGISPRNIRIDSFGGY